MGNTFQVYLLTFLLVSVFILALSLTLHVILRGLWIGAIGLRYVSGEIEYEKLEYTDRFRSYLERKVGPFDKLIAELEKYCSVIFATAFLTVFYILSLFIISGLGYLSNFLILAYDSMAYRYTMQVLVLLTLGIGTILTFIDFLSLGALKRSKWLGKLYFPYYRVFSVLTLSFIYRPIIYNLLDNKFGKRLVRLIVPLYISFLVLISVSNVTSNYVPVDFEDRLLSLEQIEKIASPLNYNDEIGDDKFVRIISIPSKSITTQFLPIFVPFGSAIEEQLYNQFPDLLPENDQRGLTTSIIRFQSLTLNERKRRAHDFLDRFAEVYEISIDGTEWTGDFIISQNIRGQSGMETYLDLKDLSRGAHMLSLSVLSNDQRTTIANVPFWYYPD